MSTNITKTYSVRCSKCRETRQFVEKGKKHVVRFLKSHGWTLDPIRGWRCPKHRAKGE